TEVEQECGGGVILYQVTVDPGADAQPRGVDVGGGDEGGAEGGEAVAAFGPHVGALVGVAQVVHAEVVGGGDRGDVAPTLLGGYASGGGADDERDLALEGEQFAAVGAFDGSADREGGARFKEVPGLLGAATALCGARGVVEVN